MERIVYYKTASPYPNDFTKFCSLNGIEIDNNFLTLEGRDVKSISIEGNYIVITLYNGKKVKTEITSIYGGYRAGEGIDQDAFNNDKIIQTNARLIKIPESITVEGQSIGSYNDGDVINQGTSVHEILKNMLYKVYDVVPIPPVANIDVKANNVSLKECYEVGTALDPITIAINVDADTKGYFVGEDGWEHQISAGCNGTMLNFFYNNSEIGNKIWAEPLATYKVNDLTEGEGYTFALSFDYNQSIRPNKSDGTQSDVIIPAGTTPKVTASFNVAYKYYYGYIPMHPWAVYDDIITSKEDIFTKNLNLGWCTINGDTVINTMESIEGKTSLILILPEKYKNIKYTQNTLGAPIKIDERWKQQKHNGSDLQITYTTGGITTTYYVYILHSLFPFKYNNITFGEE